MLKFIAMFSFLLVCGWGESCMFIISLCLLFLLSNPLYHNISMFFMDLDYFGWNLILLSFWVVLLSILSSMKIYFYFKLNKLYLCVVVFMGLFLIVSFMVSDFFMFYVMFEACLIPILMMVLGWGYQPERSQAGLYMFMYTLLGSLPLFFGILYLNKFLGSSYMSLNWSVVSSLLFVFLIIGFLVKFPMYSVHLWLLKAHVEAPVAGSMILAGVLLKLGGYGLIRFSNMFLKVGVGKEFIIVLSLWGGFMLSIVCLRFMDMKLLIAASSVVHMSSCICGIFILTNWGIKGCLVMMISHGLCSSGLFCLANIIYERTNSRSMLINKGLLNILPTLGLFWFLLIVCNMAGPPSYNLVGEMMLLVSVINWINLSVMVLFLLGFFSVAYSLYLYSVSQHGVFVKIKSSMSSSLLLEFFVIVLHCFPLFSLILCVGFFLYFSMMSFSM